jgi:hypothetical protein
VCTGRKTRSRVSSSGGGLDCLPQGGGFLQRPAPSSIRHSDHSEQAEQAASGPLEAARELANPTDDAR